MNIKEKEKIVRAMIDVVIPYINKNGSALKDENSPGKALQLEVREFNLIYSTPFTRLEILPGEFAKYGLNVWANGQGKVLSVWWEPFDLRCFKNGQWVDKILQLS